MLRVLRLLAVLVLVKSSALSAAEPAPTVVTPTAKVPAEFATHGLPFGTVFIGRDRFDQLIARAEPAVGLPNGPRSRVSRRDLAEHPRRST